MRVRYEKKQVNLNLYLGLFWLLNGIVKSVIDKNVDFFDCFWFLISGIYLCIFFYQKKEKYLTLENETIKQNWPFGKKIKLREIKAIKHFAGEFILKSELKKMKINISLIESESLFELKTELNKLDVEWN